MNLFMNELVYHSQITLFKRSFEPSSVTLRTILRKSFTCYIQYPLFCLLCVLCSTFGGSMMVNFFTYRKPILSGLLTPRPVAITVAAWWLIFYCPMNAFEKICSMKPVLLIMVILKEQRLIKITKLINYLIIK